jgi:hypothetical protein
MEHKSSLPRSNKPVSNRYPDENNPRFTTQFLQDTFNIILLSMPTFWTQNRLIGRRMERNESSFITCTLARYNYSDHVKEDEMGRACSTHGEKRNAYTIWVDKPKGKR